MLPRLPPAVYRCIIPAKIPLATSSAVYHTPLDEPEGELPFLAWPEIKDANQPCCLPTLSRALYHVEYGRLIEPEECATRAEEYVSEYLSRLKDIEPDIRERIRILCRNQLHRLRLQDSAEVIVDIHKAEMDLLRKVFPLSPGVKSAVDQMDDVLMQASIYGGLENYPGAKDGDFTATFSDAHELGHRQARWCFNGVALDKLAECTHRALEVLLTTEKLPGKWIAKFWVQFVEANTLLVYFAKKFEPVEEIFATALGMRFLPPDVRKKVKVSVTQALIKRNWLTAYNSFVEACDSYEGIWRQTAFLILETVCRISNKFDVDNVNIIYLVSEIYKLIMPDIAKRNKINEQGSDFSKGERSSAEMDANKKIERILEQAGIDADVFWPTMSEAIDELEKNGLYWKDQFITLIGQPSRKLITPVIRRRSQQADEDEISLGERTFYESLRQQLSEPCGIVCPFAHKGQPCCGLKEALMRLYKRIPKKDKINFEEPNCDRIR